MRDEKGVSLLEVIMGIAILGILTAVVLVSFFGMRREQAAISNRDLIIATLTEVKSDTLASKNGKSYGVYVDSTANQLVVFEGTTYVAGAPTNRVVALDNKVPIKAVGGGTSIVFDRLTGMTDNLYSIVINTPIGTLETQKTVYVFRTGVILTQ